VVACRLLLQNIGAFARTTGKHTVVDSMSSGNGCSEINCATVEESITVPATNNTGKRIRDKKYHCLYCGLEVAQLPRHLYSIHSDEHEVVELMAATDHGKRNQLLMKIRNMGNHKHNLTVLREGSGKITVVYRPNCDGGNSSAYVPCPHCYGYYGRREMWKHVRRCPLAPCSNQGGPAEPAGKQRMKPLRAGDQLLTCTSSDEATLVLSGMRKGAIFMAVKNDPVVHELARKLMFRAGHSVHHINYVRARIRKIGRLLLQVRKDNVQLRCATVRMLLDPKHFKVVIAAVRSICGYCSQSHRYVAPSTALHLGHDLRKCAVLLKSMALQEDDHMTVSLAQSFADLCSADWNYEIAGGARRELQARKFNNPKLLPLTADVMKLTTHLKDVQSESVSIVQQKARHSDFAGAFTMLMHSTLAHLILFNRRRQGEVSKLTVERYNANAKKVACFSEVQDCLSPLEQKLCQFFTRIEVPGKRNNCVPLLITDE